MAAKKQKVEKDNAERWMLTYADLMNLLLIFFIILYAISQVDAAKFSALSSSLRAAFGDSSATTYIGTAGASNSMIDLENSTASAVIPEILEKQQMEEAKKQVDDIIKESNLDSKVKVEMQERGIKISINAQYLFRSGSAQFENTAKPTIQEIGKVILSKFPDNLIRIEGHTDSDPIKSSQFPSNWELSAVRAINVLKLLTDEAHINPKNISATCYGEYQPVAANTTEANKALNRRVDIIILYKSFDKGEAGSPSVDGQTGSTQTASPVPSNKPSSTEEPPKKIAATQEPLH